MDFLKKTNYRIIDCKNKCFNQISSIIMDLMKNIKMKLMLKMY